MWRRRSDSAARIMGNARRKALISHAAPFGAAGIETKGEAGTSPLGDTLPLCRGFSGATPRLPSACANRASAWTRRAAFFPAVTADISTPVALGSNPAFSTAERVCSSPRLSPVAPISRCPLYTAEGPGGQAFMPRLMRARCAS